jgi:hypothetical protein
MFKTRGLGIFQKLTLSLSVSVRAGPFPLPVPGSYREERGLEGWHTGDKG